MSNIFHNKQDTIKQICDGDEEGVGYMYLNYEEWGSCISHTYIPRSERLCEDCEYEPDWIDAFCDDNINATKCITGRVVKAIEDLGYDCCKNQDTEHYDDEKIIRSGLYKNIFNHCKMITKIVKSDTGEVVHPTNGFLYGYDDRHYSEVLPADILEAIAHIGY